MKSYADIAKICRTVDAFARSHPGDDLFPTLFKQFGIDEEGASGVARQRALRAYLISHGRELPLTNEPVAVDIPEEGYAELSALSASWLDGLIIGMSLARPRWDRVTTEEEGGR